MAAVSLLVLLVLGVFLPGSLAIKCYSCASLYGGECDDNWFDPNHYNVRVLDCATREFDACWYGWGKARGKKTYIFLHLQMFQ